MLTLIGREIRDHSLFIALPWFFTVAMICIAMMAFWWGVETQISLVLAANLTGGLFMGLCGLGVSQIYGDRAGGVSLFLSTLAVTRGQIFVAKVLVGALTLIVAVIPLVVSALALPGRLVPQAPSYHWLVAEMTGTITLAGFACYCMGLVMGWVMDKAWLFAGSILLTVLTASVIYIKGFGIDTMAILLLLTAAVLLRTWSKFVSTSL